MPAVNKAGNYNTDSQIYVKRRDEEMSSRSSYSSRSYNSLDVMA